MLYSHQDDAPLKRGADATDAANGRVAVVTHVIVRGDPAEIGMSLNLPNVP